MRLFFINILGLVLVATLHAKPVTDGYRETIDVDYDDVAVREILADVAEKFRLQVDVPDALNHRATFHLKRGNWTGIFPAVLAPAGYGVVERDGRIVVLTNAVIDALGPQQRRVETFNQRPAVLAAFLEKSFPGSTVRAGSESVTIVAPPRMIPAMLELIKDVDFPYVRLDPYPRQPNFPARIPELPSPGNPPQPGAAVSREGEAATRYGFRHVDCEAVTQILEREFPSVAEINIDYLYNTLYVTAEPPLLNKIKATADYLDDRRWYDPTGQPPPPAKTRRPAPERAGLERDGETVTVHYENAPIRQILAEVAEQFDLQVVLPDQLDDTTSINLRDVSWRQVFQVVLSPYGYSCIEREDLIVVLPTAEIDALPVEQQRVEVLFQRPADLAAALGRQYGAKLDVQTADDAVTVSAHPRLLGSILEFIRQHDSPYTRLDGFVRMPVFPEQIPNLRAAEEDLLRYGGPQDEVSTMVFILQWVDLDSVKKVLDREYPSGTKIAADRRSNSLIVAATPPLLLKVDLLVNYLDDRRWYPTPAGEPTCAPLPSQPKRRP